MKTRLFILSLLVLLFSVAAAAAVTGYSLPWWTADGGGGTSSGTGYSLSGTIGQPDAGRIMSGPGYQLAGGFWDGTLSQLIQRFIYLPLIKK